MKQKINNNPPPKSMEEKELQEQLEQKFSPYKLVCNLIDPSKGEGELEREYVDKYCRADGKYSGYNFDRNSPILQPMSLRTITSATAPGFGGQAPRLDLSVFPGEYSLLETIGEH